MYKLRKYLDGIYLVEFEVSYTLAMTFLRYQEFYECVSDDIRGKQFTILQFIDWYISDNDYCSFAYHLDWSGFNIPANIISEVRDLGILDLNHYDAIMLDIYNEALELNGNPNFYIIGTTEGDSFTLAHEVAHGLYYINEEYRKEMNDMCDMFTDQSKSLLAEYLTETGYPDKVHIDEMQAYLSTGSLHLNSEISGKASKFKQILQKYLI